MLRTDNNDIEFLVRSRELYALCDSCEIKSLKLVVSKRVSEFNDRNAGMLANVDTH